MYHQCLSNDAIWLLNCTIDSILLGPPPLIVWLNGACLKESFKIDQILVKQVKVNAEKRFLLVSCLSPLNMYLSNRSLW